MFAQGTALKTLIRAFEVAIAPILFIAAITALWKYLSFLLSFAPSLAETLSALGRLGVADFMYLALPVLVLLAILLLLGWLVWLSIANIRRIAPTTKELTDLCTFLINFILFVALPLTYVEMNIQSKLITGSIPPGGSVDRYYGDLLLRPMFLGRHMQVVNRFGYIDPDNVDWPVNAGFVSDGASIPKPLWSLIGGPWDGSHRWASIIHDFYCEHKVRSWEDMHRVFYFALLTSKVDKPTALILYYSVYRFGPRWRRIPTPLFDVSGRLEVTPAPPFIRADFDEARAAIAAGKLEIDDVRGLAERQMKSAR